MIVRRGGERRGLEDRTRGDSGTRGGVSMRRWGPINGKIYFTGFEENVNVS